MLIRMFLALAVAAGVAAADPVTPFAQTGDLFLLEDTTNSVVKVTPGGAPSVEITSAQIMAVTGLSVDFSDNGIAFSSGGTMFFTEATSDSLLKYEGGVLSVLANETALAAALGRTSASPEGVTVGSDGFVYVVEASGDGIVKVDPVTGAVTSFAPESAFAALPGISGISPDSGIVAGPSGDIFVAEDGNDILFKIDSTGTVTIVGDDASFADFDVFIARAPNGDIIVADDAGGDVIWRIKSDGTFSTFLSEAAILAVIGSGSDVDLEGGIAFDGNGNFYLAEETSGMLLKFTPALAGSIFVDVADFTTLLGVKPDWEGIAFAPGTAPVPEPGTLVLAAAGMGAFVALRRRRRRATR